MKAYRMPEWQHRAGSVVVGWCCKGIREGRPIRWDERAVLKLWALFMEASFKAGVWGRL